MEKVDGRIAAMEQRAAGTQPAACGGPAVTTPNVVRAHAAGPGGADMGTRAGGPGAGADGSEPIPVDLATYSRPAGILLARKFEAHP